MVAKGNKCAFCCGEIHDRRITHSEPLADGRILVIKHVPVGLCEECFEKFFDSDVSAKLDSIIEHTADSGEYRIIVDYMAV